MNIRYSNHISWQLMDNKAYIIDEITHMMYTLEDVAKDFWLLINSYNSLEAIINNLSLQYCVSRDIIFEDINNFKNMLLSQKLVTEGDC